MKHESPGRNEYNKQFLQLFQFMWITTELAISFAKSLREHLEARLTPLTFIRIFGILIQEDTIIYFIITVVDGGGGLATTDSPL